MFKVNSNKIVFLRISGGYSITKLAKRAKISKATLSRIEKKEVVPNPATIGKIAKVLGIPVMDLFIED